MSTFVLVHGASHGAWCWYKIIPLLERQGHTVIVPDLPGHGIDRTPVNKVSLDGYANRIGEILGQQQEPVILVGHSMGGIVITRAAEQWPDRVGTLVYLTAFLLENGRTLFEEASTDTNALVLPNAEPTDDNSAVNIRAGALREAFYGDCSEEDIALAKTLLVPQALLPLNTPVQTSAGNFGRVPRVYIEATQDRAITLAAQKKMHTAQPCREVFSMHTGHSPFFSAPRELAGHLLSLA